MANYRQSPTSDEGALIRRDWWRDYPDHQNPPPVDVKVMAWDTAFSAKTTADRSAMVVWGTLSQRDGEGNIQQGIMLLDAFAARLDFPVLKMKAVEMQERWPDYLLIENKGTGMPLIQELLRAGIFAQEANPHRGSDKHMRTNAVADLFKNGLVCAPLGLRWVEQVRDEMAAFPHDENDDLHDAAVYRLLRIRQGGLMRLSSDLDAEYQPRRPMEYY